MGKLLWGAASAAAACALTLTLAARAAETPPNDPSMGADKADWNVVLLSRDGVLMVLPGVTEDQCHIVVQAMQDNYKGTCDHGEN